jgi:RNA polymerase sigma factor (sigma-70 family)
LVRHIYDGWQRRRVTVDDHDWLAERFEQHRPRLRAIAYRMLGSDSEADDAVQEVWLKISRRDVSDVENLGGWLTAVAGRVCLDQLRSRKARHEEPLDLDLPGHSRGEAGADPEHEAVLADSVGIALLVVLDTLTPAERLAFVLHDMFAVPFDQIGAIVDRSPDAAKMLASRARRRLRTADTVAETDVTRQRRVVDAFLAASRDGDFEALLAVLDPDVVARADPGAVPAGMPAHMRGARAVAKQALAFSQRVQYAKPALVNGAVGIAVAPHGRLSTVMMFTIARGRIVDIEVVTEPGHLRQIDLAALD